MAIVSDFVPPGYFMAICTDCLPIQPMSFESEEDRDGWAATHVMRKKHNVIRANGPEVVGEFGTTAA